MTVVIYLKKNNLFADSYIIDTDDYQTSWTQTHTNRLVPILHNRSFTTLAESHGTQLYAQFCIEDYIVMMAQI